MTFSREIYREARDRFEPIPWVVRPMVKADDTAFSKLLHSSPEMGLISIEVTYKEGISPFEILTRKQGQQVFVAEVPEGMENAGQVVATAACDPRLVWFEGKPTEAVHLHSLLVDPNYRHQGIATVLIQTRIRWAHEKYGEKVLIFAEIPQDDMAAFKAAAKWASDFTQPRESGFLPTLRQLPHNPKGYVIHEAQDADYAAIIAGINDFNHDVDFTRVVDYDRLHRNLSPIGGYVYRHRFVVCENDEIVGGAVLSEHDPSIVTRMVKAPVLNRVIAQLSGMIHTNGEIRGGEVDGIWYKPGCADASHYLVQYLLFEARKAQETTEALNFVISNPKVWEAVQVSHWQPHTILCVAYLRPSTPP
jgi:GNAT superfamily N-acetyltransferase